MYIPKKVKFILNRFNEHNYEAFMVGGCVRDNLLNRVVNDYDIATNAPPTIIQSLFDKTIPTGIKHGTITIIIEDESFEVTTYRIDGEYKDNRKPADVIFVSDISKDLSRRDFTINALAYNPESGIIDYFNGINDLNSKIIKAVGKPAIRFNEDALRILRAIRFSAQLDFDIDLKTFLAIKDNSFLIANISVERIRDELIKMINSNNPLKAISYLIECNILSYIFKDLTCSIETLKNSLQTFMVLPNSENIRLAHFLYYLFNGNLDNISSALKLLKFDKLKTTNIITISKYKNSFINISNESKLKPLINSIGFKNTLEILNYNILEYPNLENKLNKLKKLTEKIYTNHEPIFLNDLNINGTDLAKELGLKGRDIWFMLNTLLNELYLNPSINNKSDLLKLAKNKLYLIK